MGQETKYVIKFADGSFSALKELDEVSSFISQNQVGGEVYRASLVLIGKTRLEFEAVDVEPESLKAKAPEPVQIQLGGKVNGKGGSMRTKGDSSPRSTKGKLRQRKQPDVVAGVSGNS